MDVTCRDESAAIKEATLAMNANAVVEVPPCSGWKFGIERGPDWLFVRLEAAPGNAASPELAESIWTLLRENLTHRVVLELEDAGEVDDRLATAIGMLGDRVRRDGGLIRVCGLSEVDASRLRAFPGAGGVPHFSSRAAAVGRDLTGRDGTIGPVGVGAAADEARS